MLRALALALAFALVIIAAPGCNKPQRQNDWRSPSNTDPSRRPPPPPATCTSDADCAASRGICAIELGAAEGTCTTPPGLAPVPRGDGGPGPVQPIVPNVQPSPSDIHI